jgi:hypothetical protein
MELVMVEEDHTPNLATNTIQEIFFSTKMCSKTNISKQKTPVLQQINSTGFNINISDIKHSFLELVT